MTESQRAQFERAELGHGGDRLSRVSPTGEKVLGVLTPIFVIVLGALVFAAYQVFDGWPHAIVIADIVIVTLAIAAWIYNTNRGRPG